MPETTFCEAVGQEVIIDVMDCGLRVVVLPKPGFQTRFAAFATKYGGIHNAFCSGGAQGVTTMPEGIAHFLEHKMFDQPDGSDVGDTFSRMGVDANAMTYKTRTAYVVTAPDDATFASSFELLLDYVQTPYFTPESVAKEQGIIQQEIVAGLDNPDSVAMDNLEAAMYLAHPVATKIAGSVESVGGITADHLYLCHSLFYHPSNMMVVVSGDVDSRAIFRAVGRDVQARDYQPRAPIELPLVSEPPEVCQAHVQRQMKVGRPMAYVGFKGPLSAGGVGVTRAELQKRRLLGSLVGDAIFGRATQWYWDLYAAGVLTSGFGSSFSDYGSACHLIVGGETEDWERLVDEVEAALSHARDFGIEPEAFELSRRSALGRVLSAVDSPEELALRYLGDAMDGIDMMALSDVLGALRVEEAMSFLVQLVGSGRRAVSVIVPMGKGEEEL